MGVFFWLVMITLFAFFSFVSIWFNQMIGTSFSSWLIWNKTEMIINQELLMKEDFADNTEYNLYFPKCIANIDIRTRDWTLKWVRQMTWRCMSWDMNWKWYRIFFFTPSSFWNTEEEIKEYLTDDLKLKNDWNLYYIHINVWEEKIEWWVHYYNDRDTNEIIDSQWLIYIWNEQIPNRVLPDVLI